MFGNNGGSGPNKTSTGSGFNFTAQTATSGAGTGTGFNFGALGSTGNAGFNFQSSSSQTPKVGQACTSGTGTGFAFENQGSTVGTGLNLPPPYPTGSVSKDAAPLSSTSTGFVLGTSSLPSTIGSGFPLGTASTGLGFSQGGTTSTAVGFGFGSAPITSTTSGSGGGGFQSGGSAIMSNPNLSNLLGKQPVTTITAGTGSTTGTSGLFASPVPGSGGFKLGGSMAASAPISTASQAQVSTTASTGFNFGTTTTATSSSTAPGFSFASTTSTAPMLGQTAALTSATSGFGLGGTSLATSLSKLPSTTSVATTSTATSTSGAPSGSPTKQMNYRQLEEQINKWMLDLEEQERVFLQQATQVNAWDRLLVDNGEKILSLNQDMERVKIDQQKLDHELDFIHSQQRELEDLLVPLEKSVEQLPSSSFLPHADLERENTYQLAENIDAQLKRMLQDLKEIIDHLNTSNSGQDNQDPIQQITKILNAHMDSLQWIDSNSALLSRRVEEISKQMETQRKEQERSFRLVYD